MQAPENREMLKTQNNEGLLKGHRKQLNGLLVAKAGITGAAKQRISIGQLHEVQSQYLRVYTDRNGSLKTEINAGRRDHSPGQKKLR